MKIVLPPFPIDDSALDMLSTALDPGPDAERTCVGELLALYSEMAGSDLSAVDEDDELNGDHVKMMRDPSYHELDVIKALIAEVRRLRSGPSDPALLGGSVGAPG